MTRHNPDTYPQPKYKFGQKVKINIETTDQPTGTKFKNTLEMYIRTIYADSNSHAVEYYYGLTLNMPQAYYAGDFQSRRVHEKEIIVDDESNP